MAKREREERAVLPAVRGAAAERPAQQVAEETALRARAEAREAAEQVVRRVQPARATRVRTMRAFPTSRSTAPGPAKRAFASRTSGRAEPPSTSVSIDTERS